MFLNEEDTKIKKVSEEGNTGVFALEPLPYGYAHTLGASIRRVLLASLKGSAPTQVEIEGALHPFSTIKGIKEDVVEISLNLKKLRVKMHTSNPVVLIIDEKGPKTVTGKDIQCPSDAEVINKDLVIASLSDAKTKFKATIVVEEGFGYVPAEERKNPKVGVISLDSSFSPVVSVGYKVEPARVGHVTNLDKLIMEIKTDGTVLPFEVFTQACTILRNFYQRFATGKESLKEEVVEVKTTPSSSAPAYKPSEVSVEELHLPTRTINALKKSGVNTLADLSKLEKEDLSKIRNLGEKSIEEIAHLLEKEGLKK